MQTVIETPTSSGEVEAIPPDSSPRQRRKREYRKHCDDRDRARIDVMTHVLALPVEDISTALRIEQGAVRAAVESSLATDLVDRIDAHGVCLGIVAHCNPELTAA